MSAASRPCHACGARRGEQCRPSCIGYALHLEQREPVSALTASEVDGILARAMTVQASKLYAALHYRAELDEHHDAPGATS